MTDLHAAPRRVRLRTWLAALGVVLTAGCSTMAPPAEPAPPPQPQTPAPQVAPEPPPPPVVAVAPVPEPPPAPRPPPPPRGRLDPDVDSERASLWERIRSGMAIPDLDDEWVRKWEQFYGSRPEYVQRMMERGSRYLFHIVEEVDRRGLPMELALLPFIESAFNPQAMSRASASGMWQFMPATGKDFELRQNLFRDDRRDVLASTDAALDYLERLQRRFGDWHLALAAYNWGQGNVQRALDRQQRAGLPLEYASLRGLPLETREYVRKLQAVKNIVLRPQAHALELPKLENHPFFLSIPIEHDIDVDLVARLSGLSPDEFRQLNPQLNKPVILAAGTPQVLLPYDAANRFVRALKEHQGPQASWTAWVAPRTLKPADAARMVGMPEAQLREVNAIPARMLVKVGSTLLVPRASHASGNVSEHIADHAALALAPEFRKAPARTKAKAAGRAGPARAVHTTSARPSGAAARKSAAAAPRPQARAARAAGSSSVAGRRQAITPPAARRPR